MSDPVMARITAAIAQSQRGDRDGARREFEAIWRAFPPDADAFHRCTLAHYLADLQDDPREELAWDLRALAAADEVTDDRAKAHHDSLSVQAFYPSLLLNVADAMRRAGRGEEARAYVERGLAACDALGDDGYGRMIRGGLERLAQRLADAP